MSLVINPQIEMKELLSSYPSSKRALFARYHIGGCRSCSYDESASLESVCQANDLEVTEVIQHIVESYEHDQKMLVSSETLKTWMDEGKSFVLLDARTREEFEEVPMPNAKFLNQDIQQALFAGNSETTVVLFDHDGSRILDVCAWFRGHQLKNTFGLIGGIDTWAKEVDDSIARYELSAGE